MGLPLYESLEYLLSFHLIYPVGSSQESQTHEAQQSLIAAMGIRIIKPLEASFFTTTQLLDTVSYEKSRRTKSYV